LSGFCDNDDDVNLSLVILRLNYLIQLFSFLEILVALICSLFHLEMIVAFFYGPVLLGDAPRFDSVAVFLGDARRFDSDARMSS